MESYSVEKIDNGIRLEKYNETGERLLAVDLQKQNNEQSLQDIIYNAVLSLIILIDFDELSKKKYGVEAISLQILNHLGASIALNQPWITSQDNEFRYLNVVEECIKKIKQLKTS